MGIKVGDALMYLGIEPGNFHQEMQKVRDDQDELKKKNKEVQDTLRAVGAAFTAVGAGGLLMAASARKTMADLGALAITTGHTTQEMKNLVLSTTDVGLGIKELTNTLDQLSRAGEHNLDNLKVEAKAFDALGHATGQGADTVTSMLLPAYKALNIELPKTANELDSLTWLTHNTIVDLGDFAGAMSWVAREGANLNVSMDDMVAMLAALEARGITGTVAIRTFRSAVTEAVSKNESLAKALNISQYEIDAYKAKLKDATGITQKYADEAEKQYGIMDKLKQTWSELTLRAGTFLEPLEPILALMTALGPVMLFFSTAVGLTTLNMARGAIAQVGYIVVMGAWKVALGLATAAQWALNVAMTANPIGVVIAGVVALTGVVYGLVKGLQWLIGRKQEDTLATMDETQAQKEHNKAVADAQEEVTRLTDGQEALNKLITDAKAKYQDASDSSAGYASAIAEQEHNLSNTNYALDQAKDKLAGIQKSYDVAAVKVKGFEDAIADANNELNKLSNPKLQGMQAFDDRIQGYQLQINDLNVTLAGQKVSGADTTAVEAQIERIQNLINLAEAEKTAAYDNQLYLIKQSTDAAQGQNKEMTMSDVTGGIAEWSGKLVEAQTKLTAAKIDMAAQNDLLTVQQGVVNGLEAAAKGYRDVLAEIKNIVDNTLFTQQQSILLMESAAATIQSRIDTASANLSTLQQNVNAQGQLLPPLAPGATPQNTDAQGRLLPPLAKHALGGWIADPSLIVRMRDMKPTGTMSERGPEYINPSGQGISSDIGGILQKIPELIRQGFRGVSIPVQVQVGGEDVAAIVYRDGFRMLQK